jgi:hypothetical protein
MRSNRIFPFFHGEDDEGIGHTHLEILELQSPPLFGSLSKWNQPLRLAACAVSLLHADLVLRQRSRNPVSEHFSSTFTVAALTPQSAGATL